MEEHRQRSAVDAAGEKHTDRLAGPENIEPVIDRIPHRHHVAAADVVEVGRPAVPLWREEAGADGVGIGAADQGQLHDVVGGHHAGVRRMKLICEALLLKPGSNRVDSVGGDQHRTGRLLGDEVAKRPTERTGHADLLAIAVHQGKLPLDRADLCWVAGADPLDRLVEGHVEDQVACGIEQVDKAFDRFGVVHEEGLAQERTKKTACC